MLCVGSFDAVNDVVVGKGTIARLNHCDVYIDQVFVSSYQADSLDRVHADRIYRLLAGGWRADPDALSRCVRHNARFSALAHASPAGGAGHGRKSRSWSRPVRTKPT